MSLDLELNFQTGQRVVHGKYSICHKIGFGSFASVYSIIVVKRGRNIIRAIKIEHDKVANPQISTEISVLKNIDQNPDADVGFAKFYEYGYEGDYNYVVMQLLGPNLQQLLKLSGGKFSLKTALVLGLQMIDRIEVLHNAGFIYRDIKPQNFVMGLENKSQILHIIDFGKCRRYRNKQTGKHIPYKQNAKFDCEYLFSSMNTHTGTQYSRRDDVQGLVYLIIYLLKGKLPWSLIGKQFKNKKQKQSAIQEIKKKIPAQHLTFKLPLEFNDLLYYVRTLNFYQKPDYDYMRTLMHRMFKQEQDNLSMVFDWNQIEQLDFAIYSGEPRIVQRQQDVNHDNNQHHDEESIASQRKGIKESNSLDAQLLNKDVERRLSKEDKVKQSHHAGMRSSLVQRVDMTGSKEKQNINSPEKKQQEGKNQQKNLFEFLR